MSDNKRIHSEKTEPKFINRAGLAMRWLCSIETIKRREAAGLLTPHKLGRGVRYLLAQVEAIEAAAVCRRGSVR